MTLTIKIKMDNAAFEEGFEGSEASRILSELAHSIDDGPLSPGVEVNLRDVNGNTVGTAKMSR